MSQLRRDCKAGSGVLNLAVNQRVAHEVRQGIARACGNVPTDERVPIELVSLAPRLEEQLRTLRASGCIRSQRATTGTSWLGSARARQAAKVERTPIAGQLEGRAALWVDGYQISATRAVLAGDLFEVVTALLRGPTQAIGELVVALHDERRPLDRQAHRVE